MGCCSSREDGNNSNEANRPINSHASGSQQGLAAGSAAPSQQGLAASSAAPSQQGLPNHVLRHIDPARRSTLPNTLNPTPPVEPIAVPDGPSLPNASASSSNPQNRHTRRQRSPEFTPLTDSTTQEWTRARLERERTDFWDTRISGQVHIWQALREVVRLLQQGELAEAQVTLDAAGCTCPPGDVWKGVYDDTGVLYKIPEWIVVEPAGLVDSTPAPTTNDGTHDSPNAIRPVFDPTGKPYDVRCRLSTNARDIQIPMRPGELVTELVRKLRDKTGIPTTTRIRIAYAGHFYEKHQTLEDFPRWQKDNVVNAMVLEGDEEYAENSNRLLRAMGLTPGPPVLDNSRSYF